MIQSRTKFLESIDAWNLVEMKVKYSFGADHIEISYHDQTAKYQGSKDDVATIACLVGALNWCEYLKFTEKGQQ